MFFHHPVFGVGLGNFLYHSTQYSNILSRKVAHNMYVEILAELGIFGLILFLSMIVLTFKSIKQVKRRAKQRDAFLWAQALEMSLIGFLFCGLFGSIQFRLSLWVLIALSVALRQIALKGSRI